MNQPSYDLGTARGRINYAIGVRAPVAHSEAYVDQEYLRGIVDGYTAEMNKGDRAPLRHERAKDFRLRMALHHTGVFGGTRLKFRTGYPKDLPQAGDKENN